MQEDLSGLFVVVPSYNEASTINNVVLRLLQSKHIVVVVDDGSSVPCRLPFKGFPIYYLKHKINLGQGAALQTGIDFALSMNARFIATFDADDQHSVDDLNNMFSEIKKGNLDIIFGSRFIAGSQTNAAPFRKLLLQFSRFANFFISGILLSDANNGLRIFTSEAARKIRIKENRRTHCTDIIFQVAQQHMRYSEYPVTISYSDYSVNKGIKNTDGFSIFMNMLLYKIFK